MLLLSSFISSAASLVTLLVIWVIVMVIAYYTTKFVAVRTNGNLHATNIEVIETYRISNVKFIQIVRIGEKYMAIAITKEQITPLCELSESEIVKISKGEQSEASFKQIFDKMKQISGNKSRNKDE